MTREERLIEARKRVAAAERMGHFSSRPPNNDPQMFNAWYDAVFPSRSYERDRKMVKDVDRQAKP